MRTHQCEFCKFIVRNNNNDTSKQTYVKMCRFYKQIWPAKQPQPTCHFNVLKYTGLHVYVDSLNWNPKYTPPKNHTNRSCGFSKRVQFWVSPSKILLWFGCVCRAVITCSEKQVLLYLTLTIPKRCTQMCDWFIIVFAFSKGIFFIDIAYTCPNKCLIDICV